MPAKVLWSPQARKDLLEIYIAIGSEDPAAAERFYTAMEGRADLLSRLPRLGVRRSDIRPSFRMLAEGVYLLFYSTYPDADRGAVDRVRISRVVDGRRDLTRLF